MDRLANKDGLNLIKVEKAVLLDKLIANRDAHVVEYNEAVAGFRLSVITELEDYLSIARTGNKIRTSIKFDEPVCHEDDYNTIIEMLEMSIEDELYITMTEFKQYVQDNWHWKQNFEITSMKYVGLN